MEAQLLQEAIAEYEQSLQSIAEALEASPGEDELIELKSQLEAALQDAEAALKGLQPTAAGQPATKPAADGIDGASAAARGSEVPAALPRTALPSSNNARIHPRSKYAYEEPNFEVLAARYPSLQPFLLRSGSGHSGAAAEEQATSGTQPGTGQQAGASGRASLDFTNPAACRELTRVLLAADFGIEWWVPLGQLVPPVTNRANYIHWLEDLLSLSAPKGTHQVAGLDIGCGANLIYPLLGAALCGWRFVGADVTPEALCWAALNLGANPHLAQQIELRQVSMQPDQAKFHADTASGRGQQQVAGQGAAEADAADVDGAPPPVANATAALIMALKGNEAAGQGIISSAVRKGERFAFCMCNPPFFESIEDAGRNPATAYGGTAAEMVYPGGELAFVTAMVQDSLRLRGAVHWYTTMVGKKATLRAVRSLLYRHGVRVLRTTEFFQGRMSRWALAWSFTADASAATTPLPRFPAAAAAGGAGPQQAADRAGPQQQQQQQQQVGPPRPVGRKLSWQVHAAPAAAAPLLDALRACLQQAGVQCKVNRAAYSIQGNYTPSQQELAAAEVQGGAAAAAAGPQAKRQRVDGGASPADASQTWQLELNLFMQHPGLFLLTAALPKSVPNAALGWFGSQARRLQQALAARWKVQA